MRKRLWSPDEDEKLQKYVSQHGFGNWSEVAKKTGLQRCGKSCRLRWINYLRPDLKRGKFTAEEKHIIVNLQKVFGNSWSKIAAHLPGRTDSDIKNFWHSHFRKKRPHIPSHGIPSHNPTISKGHGHDSAFLSAPFISGRLPLNPIHPSSLIQPLLHAPPPPPPPPPSSSLSLPFCSFSAIPSSQGMSNTPLVNIDHHQQTLSGAMSHAMPCLEDDVQLNQDKQQQHQQQQQQQANDYQGFNVESCDLLGILKCNATWFNGEKLAREKSFVPHDGEDIDNDNNNNNMGININNICGDCSASSTSCSTGDSAQQHAFYQDVIGPPEGLELVVWSCVNRPTPNEQGASGDHAVLHMDDDCPNEEHYTPFLELQ